MPGGKAFGLVTKTDVIPKFIDMRIEEKKIDPSTG
jgi:hypothetical protein